MMNSVTKKNIDTDINLIDNSGHLVRQRVNALLTESAKKPYVTVCAGVGYGKTRAVYDCMQKQDRPYFWIQLNESDDCPERFWKDYTDTIANYNPRLVEKYRELGFPDTQEKMDVFLKIRYEALLNKPYILVFDDFHLLHDRAVLHFVETLAKHMPPCSTKILIGRDMPNINIEALQIKGSVSEIHETDLNFTISELSEYFGRQDLRLDSQTIHEIFKDTEGWAFAVNLVARSLKRVPNYFGYVKTTLKQNIYKLMEIETWDIIPEPLKRLLARLSLIDHLSVDLVRILANEDDGLLNDLKKQSAYIRSDSYGCTYLIHHLFLRYLYTKQDILSAEEKHETYRLAADWCKQHNFNIDALNYYEKIGDYESIVSVFYTLPLEIPYDIAQYAKELFERAPAEAFNSVHYFASMHLCVVYRLGDMQEFFKLAELYERKFAGLPKDNAMRISTLSAVYLFWGLARCAYADDGNYDFDVYFEKMSDCMTQEYFDTAPPVDYPRAPWINLTYSSEKGAPQKYIEAAIRSDKAAARFSNGVTAGADFLIQGELLFYQGNAKAAESLVARAAENAEKRMAYDTLQRALFYLMRISIAEGNIKKAETVLQDMENLLGEKNYLKRFSSYDIFFGWFQYILRQPELFPQWLTEKFAPYTHASSSENFGNQTKARYCYLTRNYLPLLSYIAEMKQRESFLYGRIEMFVFEACAHYKMKNKNLAWKAFREAYEAAAPNAILMPFIELGKDMRTLTAAALREKPGDIGIPRLWLESVKHKATTYAKRQSMFISEYKLSNSNNKVLSAREQEVLINLYNGLSQSEIAAKLSLSVNTIKMIIRNLYDKLYVHKISDLIRVAIEQRLV